MARSISNEVRDAAAKLIALPESGFAPALTKALAALFPNLFVAAAAIRDSAGNETGAFEAVISTKPVANGVVDADSVACAICAYPMLDETALRDSYDRIREAKSLVKTPVPDDNRSNVTMGAVVAARTTFSLSDLAQAIRGLNKGVATGRHPDMVCVLAKGAVDYGMQFPGDQGMLTSLPPSEGPRSFVPPNFLHLTTVATTSFALNHLVAYIIGQLAFFAPGTPLPDMNEIRKDVPSQRTIVASFQFDTTGKLVEAVGREQPIHPYTINDSKHNRLLGLAFIPWQDGGVIIAEGKLPLTGVLLLAGRPLPLMVHRPPGGRQLSSVLPIDVAGFINVMANIAKRMKGVVVRKSTQNFTIAPFLDEGTSSPFGARILMALPMLRAQALYDQTKVAEFDTLFEFVINHLIELRTTLRELLDLWQSHAARVESGEAVRRSNAYHVTEPIHQKLSRFLNILVTGAARVAKKIQYITKIFGTDIGFLFDNDKEYEKKLPKLAATDPELASYVAESRKWLHPLRAWRIAMEHKNYVPPKLQYQQDADGAVHVIEPEALGLPLRQYFVSLLSHLNRFVEEVIVWCVQRSLPDPMTIVEIPVSERDPIRVVRFKVAMKGTGETPWVISYSDDDFDKV
jgi:hypothetical protein